MNPPMEDDPQTDLKQKLLGETAKVAWGELQTFFAKGMVIRVSAGLDLINVAAAIAADDKSSVTDWMESGQLARVNDEEAHDWHRRDPTLWAVVVAPWILVQERSH